MIARVVPFELRAEIEAAVLTPASEKKSPAGRKPIDVMVMFRMLVLQSLYNLSDEQRSSTRSAVVHAVSGARHRGRHSGRHDVVAVPRDACEGRSG